MARVTNDNGVVSASRAGGRFASWLLLLGSLVATTLLYLGAVREVDALLPGLESAAPIVVSDLDADSPTAASDPDAALPIAARIDRSVSTTPTTPTASDPNAPDSILDTAQGGVDRSAASRGGEVPRGARTPDASRVAERQSGATPADETAPAAVRADAERPERSSRDASPLDAGPPLAVPRAVAAEHAGTPHATPLIIDTMPAGPLSTMPPRVAATRTGSPPVKLPAVPVASADLPSATRSAVPVASTGPSSVLSPALSVANAGSAPVTPPAVAAVRSPVTALIPTPDPDDLAPAHRAPLAVAMRDAEATTTVDLPALRTALDAAARAIVFEPESTTLTDFAAPALARVTELLEPTGVLNVTVTVTTREYVSEAGNRALALARARALVNRLTALGLDRSRLEVAGEMSGALADTTQSVSIEVGNEPG